MQKKKEVFSMIHETGDLNAAHIMKKEKKKRVRISP